jgi:cytochrome c-type protein NapB
MKKIIIVAILAMLSIVSAHADNINGCLGCHGKQFKKSALGSSKKVSTFSEQQIVNALEGYKNGTYGGKMKGIMSNQVSRITDIKSISAQIYALNHASTVKSSAPAKTTLTLKEKMAKCKGKINAINDCANKAFANGSKSDMKKCKKKMVDLGNMIENMKKNKKAGKCGTGKCGAK